MFSALRAWRRRRVLRKNPLDPVLWRELSGQYRFVRRLNGEQEGHLRSLCILFLHEKQFSAAGGLELTPRMKLCIAIPACMLILNLDLDDYKDWVEIIVYPGDFLPRQEYRNEHGLVVRDDTAYSGQAWLRGPVILSWAEVESGGRGEGANVVMHEFAHKLDMRNGGANGFPPLHAGMNRADWVQVFTTAYRHLCNAVESGFELELDAYASESPAEFFAVMTEAFFEQPQVLARHYPRVYDQLVLFYRQDPMSSDEPCSDTLRSESQNDCRPNGGLRR